jgi:hypothetical protein
VRALLLCGALLCACGAPTSAIRPRPALVFDDSTAGLEWRADVLGGSREVRGESCRNAVGLPLFLWGGYDLVGWSEGGYRDAVAQAQAQAPGRILTDVRVDVRFINILVFRKECLEITAAVR